MRRLIATLLLALSGTAMAELPLPILDMHLHASPADANGPPPLGMCAPFPEFPLPDVSESWETRFIAWQKEPPCADPVWSPKSDTELMQQTIAVMNRRNIYGVLSGTPERVRQWSAAAPGRFIAGMGFQIGRDAITPAKLRELYAEGAFAVLAEVTNQYVGIGPSDPCSPSSGRIHRSTSRSAASSSPFPDRNSTAICSALSKRASASESCSGPTRWFGPASSSAALKRSSWRLF